MERRLAAILVADVVGYSRLMADDEEGTLARLKAHHSQVVDPAIAKFKGSIVKLMGDGLLAEFASVVDAVRCAVDIQEATSDHDSDAPTGNRIKMRIGINLGDVMVEGGDIFGDGVNIAARLEGLAEPGGICLSGTVFDHVRNKVDLAFDNLGERRLKNIPEPVRVYRVDAGGRPATAFAASIGLDFTIPDYPSIAVLPFTVMSADPEQEFFADGVAEDIITALSKISRLLVVARNSTFTYKGRAVDVKEVSREQGVRYVLEGSVRKVGGRVRVTAQLIDATTGLHVWADRYDRDLDDIFAVQDEITREIITALDVQLREGEQNRVWASGTRNLEAWECVRIATDGVLGGEPVEQVKAGVLIDRALALDPNYAIAWVMRGWLFQARADVGGGIGGADQRAEALATAFDCARKALECDPDCADAYALLSTLHLESRNYDAAVETSDKAVALAPNNAENVIASGLVMTKTGQPERAVVLQKKAMRLSPVYRPGILRGLGLAYRMAGRLEAAAACFRESLKREAGYLAPHVNLASTLGEMGRLDEAREAARNVLRIKPDFSTGDYMTGLSYRDSADLARIADGLRKAGLPE